MRIPAGILLGCWLVTAAPLALAQGPPGLREGPPESADEFVARMLEFDKDKDGKLTKREIGDERLHRLFDRADADKDGVATREELAALAAREADDRGDRPGFG